MEQYDNIPNEDAIKTIYSEKNDRTWVGGTITKNTDGTYDYSGTFKFGADFRNAGSLTHADSLQLNIDIEFELSSLLGCYGGSPEESLVQSEDADEDRVTNGGDNCYSTYNPDQLDSNCDGIGDACATTGSELGSAISPRAFSLEQNFPNPFNPVTSIFFTIPERAKVKLYVCDVSGRIVKTLVDGVQKEPGRHKATWDGRNDDGRMVSSGIYFCKLVVADKVAQTKMVILK